MAKSELDGYDLWLDVSAPCNRDVDFPPAPMRLSSEKRVDRSVGQDTTAMLKCGGSIPGHRMCVDMKGKSVKVVHRMVLPENAKKDEELRRLVRTERYQSAAFTTYPKDADFRPRDEEWPTWLWYMRRLVDRGRMEVVRGTLPSEEEILAMGEVRPNFHGYNLTPKPGREGFDVIPKISNSKPAAVGGGKP